MGSMPMQPNVPVVSVSDLPDDAVMVDVRERNEWIGRPRARRGPHPDGRPARPDGGAARSATARLAVVCR